MFYRVKYSPNMVSKKVTIDTNIRDREFSTLKLVREGTKIEFYEVAVQDTDIKRFIETYNTLRSTRQVMELAGFEVALPREAKFNLIEKGVHPVGEMVIEDEDDDLEIYGRIHYGIQGWYVAAVSYTPEVVTQINENKINKYGLSGFTFVNSIADHTHGLVMAELETFHATQTDKKVDDRYRLV